VQTSVFIRGAYSSRKRQIGEKNLAGREEGKNPLSPAAKGQG
jgi:hypothetical protein